MDTGAWFAAFVPNDPDHPAATHWLGSNREPLLTTDYVLDELLTLLKARGEFERALRIGPSILDESLAVLEWVIPQDIEAGWNTYERFNDKKWSFTDCVSREVMLRLEIRTAFAFDEHFRQFGIVDVVPHT